MKWNCDELRFMVKKLLGCGEMKVVELHRALHVSPKYYYLFMKQQGTHAGLGNIMYKKLHRFFLNREEAGVWVPEVVHKDGNRMDESEDAEDDDDQAEVEVSSIGSNEDDDRESDKENRPQDTDEGTKYNCHQIRCKITRFLINAGMMIDNFIPKLGVPLKSFHLFMKQRGPHAGIRNSTYKAAHQFFVDHEAAKPTEAKDKAKTTPTEHLERGPHNLWFPRPKKSAPRNLPKPRLKPLPPLLLKTFLRCRYSSARRKVMSTSTLPAVTFAVR